MNPNVILIAVLVLILGAAVWYIRRAKKRGQKCIGCPHSGSCGKCSCGQQSSLHTGD